MPTDQNQPEIIGSTDQSKQIDGPVRRLPGEAQGAPAPVGTALCLSGGGYRAMLFHLGTLWRLNEAGLLSTLDRVSSVSGGSITAGVLGLNWARLGFVNGVAQNLEQYVVDPIRALASHTIDVSSIVTGVLLPGTVADRIADSYREHLFDNHTLQDLPDSPIFVINSTNVQSKVLWRFTKHYMADYRVGLIPNPQTELAVAVGASSAFPPFLSPATMKLDASQYKPNSGLDLQFPPYTTKVVLTDGGVYDNLGLETAWKNCATVFVSDGGGVSKPEPEPKRDWLDHVYRVLSIINDQVGSLRKRQLIDSFIQKIRGGAYWGLRTNIADYKLASTLPCPFAKTMELANIATRLKALDQKTQQMVINWGYGVCDAALRAHVDTSLDQGTFPYPSVGVG
jgi:NTE family protein